MSKDTELGDLARLRDDNDLPAIVAEFLQQCGSCDGGLSMGCACPTRDYRPVMAHLVDEVERLRAEHLAFTSRLGFGDGVTEPAATLTQMVTPIEQAFSEARDHYECPVVCNGCGEPLATDVCEHCHGSGCGPGTALGAYDECEWCTGAGKVHPVCVERTYSELAALSAGVEA